MSNKYNWRHIPPKYQWAATDIDGIKCAYVKKPTLLDGVWLCGLEDPNMGLIIGSGLEPDDVFSTLENRPSAHHISPGCPHCGGLWAEIDRVRSGHISVLVVICTACGARGPEATTAQEAVSKWNGRQG